MSPGEAVVRLLTLSGVASELARRVVFEQLVHLEDDELRTTSAALAVILRKLGAEDRALIAEVDQVLRDLESDAG
jgi:hypothetical protein